MPHTCTFLHLSDICCCFLWCTVCVTAAMYDAETGGYRVDLKCPANQQQFTETVQIPVRNVAREKALTAAARMVVFYTRCLLKRVARMVGVYTRCLVLYYAVYSLPAIVCSVQKFMRVSKRMCVSMICSFSNKL